MAEPVQLELDLGDIEQWVRRYKKTLPSYGSLYVRSRWYGKPKWWLMLRVGGLGETEYSHVRWLTEAEARLLLEKGLAQAWFSDDYRQKKPEIPEIQRKP